MLCEVVMVTRYDTNRLFVIHLIIYTGNRWQPGDPAGNLATSWQPRLPVRTCGDWQPLLATAGNRWQPLATWQPGNLATWQPAGNLLATSAGNLATRGSSGDGAVRSGAPLAHIPRGRAAPGGSAHLSIFSVRKMTSQSDTLAPLAPRIGRRYSHCGIRWQLPAVVKKSPHILAGDVGRVAKSGWAAYCSAYEAGTDRATSVVSERWWPLSST